MNVPQFHGARAKEVWRCLGTVTDPELDEPITDMGFVERLDVLQGNVVEVDFRLPTYWCSPNFAFLMADGISRSVRSLPWVDRVKVRLQDHCFAEEVNAGVNGVKPFEAVFAKLTEGADLNEVREKFREKAFLRRQEPLIIALRAMGWSDARIVGLTLAEFDRTSFAVDSLACVQKPRYREILIEDGLACMADDPVFVEYSGDRIMVKDVSEHLRRLRAIRINMEFNGAMCRGLLATRYKEVDLTGREPELIDFIVGRVPPSAPQDHPKR